MFQQKVGHLQANTCHKDKILFLCAVLAWTWPDLSRFGLKMPNVGRNM